MEPRARRRGGEETKRLAQRAYSSPADARGHDSVPRASARGSGRSRNVARLTFDDDVGRGRLSRCGPSPTLSLWSAGVVHYLPEVIEAAARSAETAVDGIRESKQW